MGILFAISLFAQTFGCGQFGNVGRNAIRGPGIIGLDAEIRKVFRIRERPTLQFRLEAFYARNHPNWGMSALRGACASSS